MAVSSQLSRSGRAVQVEVRRRPKRVWGVDTIERALEKLEAEDKGLTGVIGSQNQDVGQIAVVEAEFR